MFMFSFVFPSIVIVFTWLYQKVLRCFISFQIVAAQIPASSLCICCYVFFHLIERQRSIETLNHGIQTSTCQDSFVVSALFESCMRLSEYICNKAVFFSIAFVFPKCFSCIFIYFLIVTICFIYYSDHRARRSFSASSSVKCELEQCFIIS